MLDKRVRIPMLAGIVMYGLSIVASLLVSLNTKAVLLIFSTIEYEEGNVFPPAIFRSMIILALYIAFYFIMRSCNGKSNRLVGIILLIVYCIPGFAGVFFSYLDNYLLVQKGTEYVVAYSSVSTAISMVTFPFTLIASVLILAAIGRYGILEKEADSEEDNSSSNVYYGG